jgi:hypothetical protein
MELSRKDLEFTINEKIFYKGVIEDNNDPLQMGRVRVRILGLHSDNLIDTPTSTLPWASIVQPLSFGGFSSGIGISSIPIQGTWVWCFVDFNDTNDIVVIGAISGINGEKLSNQGFVDPDGNYPLNSSIGLPDINLRGLGDVYTQVHTIETPGNHIIEIDDANGHMRLLHNSGSEILLTNDAVTVTAVGDRNDITSGSFNQTVLHTIQINANGAITINTAGTLNLNSNGNMNIKTNGDLNLTSGGDVNLKSTGKTVITTATNVMNIP